MNIRNQIIKSTHDFFFDNGFKKIDSPILTNSSPEGTTELFQDRKSTRLNSSHVAISYAVFCLKKKIIKNKLHEMHDHSLYLWHYDTEQEKKLICSSYQLRLR